MPTNEFGQPVGDPVPGWTPPPALLPATSVGRTCRVEPLAAAHIDQLYWSLCQHSPAQTWTYLPYGPFADKAGFSAHLRRLADDPGLVPHVITEPDGSARGVACYLRVAPDAGSAEIGHLAYATMLQRTTAATEAMFLLADNAFALGYRRYEWKCDALNAGSRAAAERLGFTFEGIFRQAKVVRGRNRDTAWYAITDAEWPRLRAGFRSWLAPENFDAAGVQHRSLRQLLRSGA